MAAKAVQKDDKVLCRECAESSYYQLDGSGIVEQI